MDVQEFVFKNACFLRCAN